MSSTPSLYMKQLGLGAASPLSGRHLLLLVLCAGFLAFTIFVVHPNEFRIQSFFSGGSCTTRDGAAATAAPVNKADGGSVPPQHAATTGAETMRPAAEDEVRVLIGIQTLPSKYERRHLLRSVYSLQVDEHPALRGSVDVRFVFCNVTSPDDAVLVALEIMRYGDIIVMDCAENMDNGKTYTFFSTVVRAFNTTAGDQRPRYDYVMKADDDTYFRLPALVSSLRNASREDAYLGLEMPCDTENFYPFPPFMSGMGYALSWDLVAWVATAELSRRDHEGPEDMWTGRWLNFAGKAKHRYDLAPRMYNYKGASPDSCFRHGFVPDTVAVHMLKDDQRWAETLTYFNATARLPRSELYHLPLQH